MRDLEQTRSLAIPEVDDDGPVYPTVIKQAQDNMRKFEDCVLLTRMGGFYELYLEHAEEYGPLLNLKVAQKKTSAGPVAMAGFPFFQLDRFLKVLVQDYNKNVAISEEFPNNALGKVKSGGLLFDRKVTRVVTPGTLVDEGFMDPYENNFLLAVYPEKNGGMAEIDMGENQETVVPTPVVAKVGLAWLDLSTGEFFTQCIDLGSLSSAIARIGAREILLCETLCGDVRSSILAMLEQERHHITWRPSDTPFQTVMSWSTMLEAQVPADEQSHFSAQEIHAGSLLLEYVHGRLQGLNIKLQPPIRREESENMIIDHNSLKGLEILDTSRTGTVGAKGSLLHAVRRTVTKGGARLLRDRIASPSTSLPIIRKRLDLVQNFLESPLLRENIVKILRRTSDSQRLVQKFSLGRGDADDLVSLLRTITLTESIRNLLQEAKQGAVMKPIYHDGVAILLRRLSLEAPNALATRISEAIDENGLTENHEQEQIESAAIATMAQDVLSHEGESEDRRAMSQVIRSKQSVKGLRISSDDEGDVWIMRRKASSTLEALHDELSNLRRKKFLLTETLRLQSEASSLALKWTPGLGHICYVRGVKDVRASMNTFGSARNVSTSKSTRSFYLPEWSSLGGEIDQIKTQLRAEERRIFQELRDLVVMNVVKLRHNAAVLDELDVACSAATLAAEQNLVRPVLNNGTGHQIIGGRHATVQLGLEGLGRAFVTNDCFVGEPQRIWLITGPNMAGKSTFLRQNALISVLAQTGFYVPAESAEIGIVDRIFSRIGSADNLYQDQSTFMVEMLETAIILKHATPRSFVIMDEVGRGTTPEDGIAVGYACLHHLYYTNRCRTLFATHFHVLTDMTKGWESIGYYCNDVAETNSGAFSYVHRLRPGVNKQSHALKVAQLAGMPDSAINVARQVLSSYQQPRKDGHKEEVVHALSTP